MCHSKTVTDAQTLKTYSGVSRHVNGIPDVVFTDINYGSYTAFKPAGKTCSNVACHGGKTRNGWQNASINTNNTCTHCHGTPTGITPANTNRKNFAPGWNNVGTSTDQVTANTDLRVGAHFVHLSSVYMKQIKCNECHTVPSTPFSGTHMTGPRYNSQSVTFSQASTATKNGLTGFTTYTSGTVSKAATCGTTYCHGGKFIQGDTAGSAKKPTWNVDYTTNTPNATNCGRCHGLPPNSVASSHAGGTLASCVGCHAQVVDAAGNIINKNLHINGVNDYQMICNGCHDYDTRSGGTVWGNTNYGGTVGLEGRGAHAKHIEYLKTRGGVITTLNPNTDTYGGAAFNAVCGVCHSTNPTNHTPANTAGTRSIVFAAARDFGGTATFNGVYNTSSGVNPKSCSNLDCHYRTSPIWSTY